MPEPKPIEEMTKEELEASIKTLQLPAYRNLSGWHDQRLRDLLTELRTRK